MKIKRMISALLALVLLIGTGVFAPTTVDAYTSRSQTEALSWINSAVGRYWDYDGAYGAQCVDLIMYYYSYLGVSPSGGNACDYAYNALPSGWSRIQYYDGFVAQPGDIAVFLGPSMYGHVALVTSADASTMYIVENNHDGSGANAANTYSYSYYSMSFYGVIRPDFAGTPSYTYTTITPGIYYLKNKATGEYLIVDSGVDVNEQNISVWPWADVNEMKYEITATTTGYKMRPLCSSSRVVNAYGYTPGHGSNVNLFNDVNDNTEWWQFEVADDGGYYIHNVFVPNCVLDTDGRNVLIANKHGGASQIWTLESVNKTPATPYFNYEAIGESIHIWWSETNNADYYDVYIHDGISGAVLYSEQNLTQTEITTYMSPGTYTVKVAAVNNNGNYTFGISDVTSVKVTDINDMSDLQPLMTFKSGVMSYEVYDYATDWETARLWCRRNGGYLMAVDSAYDQGIVETLVSELGGNCWIGGTDQYEEGTWRWTDHGEIGYSNWNTAEPNNSSGNENYMMIYADSYKWNDTFCSQSSVKGFIMQKRIYVFGDVNSDREVNLSDVSLLLKYIAKWNVSIDSAMSDVNTDENINITDVSLILKYIAGWDVELSGFIWDCVVE